MVVLLLPMLIGRELLILVGVMMGRDLLCRTEDTSISAVFTLMGLGGMYLGDACRFSFGELILIREDIPA